MKTPVLLIIFNRFDTTKKVLDQLRAASISRLYIYCDGPRVDRPSELELLKDVQTKVCNEINWNCELITNFKELNIGPRLAIGQAISWFFESETEGIILEHDCVPSLDFFPYCESLLEYYRNDERVMHISGDNFQFGKIRGDGSYYFSKITHIWGFATWKRAWQFYDVKMDTYPIFKRDKRVRDIIHHKRGQKFWNEVFEKVFNGEIQSWDYQWTYSVWLRNGLAILPNVNLVSNVGFDAEALNTKNPDHMIANMKLGNLSEIRHPSFMIHDQEADAWSLDNVFFPTWLTYGMQKLKQSFGK